MKPLDQIQSGDRFKVEFQAKKIEELVQLVNHLLEVTNRQQLQLAHYEGLAQAFHEHRHSLPRGDEQTSTPEELHNIGF